ncbi:hypothetical protein SLITO_v1c05380 [Spiroplasma litorale]|uniref:Uncharacterized protein n=1 Tax=Spiroplasma litorale TaxID=216942 RepID=A0A0K1W253_9MOLU|nr:hypothetical protein [Spiroplasma litorale]AKX34182.1 hypothetical protein SLITO_v1c05380 [Spiroplasma litorale]
MKKFLNFYSTKVKLKIIVFSSVFAFYFLLSFLMVSPGVGLESLRFINSIHDQISQVMPKGVYVIDGKDPSFNTVLESVVKKSYSADAISTLNSYETVNYEQRRNEYEKFSNDWFESKWSSYREQQKDIDLFDLGNDLVEFDKAVSTEFLSYGYVHAGIQWMFQPGGLSDIFSSERKEDLLRNQTIIDQYLYESKIKSSDPGIDGINVYDSPGTLLINNKVWYLNKQIENIKYGFNVFGHNIFKDKTLNESKMPKTKVSADELYLPHFTDTLDTLRAGVVFFFILLIVVIPGYTFTITMLIINKKKGNK